MKSAESTESDLLLLNPLNMSKSIESPFLDSTDSHDSADSIDFDIFCHPLFQKTLPAD